ncbi:MAG: LapA family protein [Propionivibrio sp.]
MRILLWVFRILIFLFLLAFALKNTNPVDVHFFFDAAWQAPMIIVVLAFFAAGALFGVLFLLGAVFGLRREVSRLKREVKNNLNNANNPQPL